MVNHADPIPAWVHIHDVWPQVVIGPVAQHDRIEGRFLIVIDLRAAVDEQIAADARPGVWVEAIELHTYEPRKRCLHISAMEMKMEAGRGIDDPRVVSRSAARQANKVLLVLCDDRVVSIEHDILPMQVNGHIGIRRVLRADDVRCSP